MAWPNTFVAGNALTAAQLNGIQVTGLAWTAFTPTITTGGVAITLGNGAIDAAYQQIGKTTFWHVNFSVGSTTSMTAGTVVIGFPASAPAKSTTNGHAVGTFTTSSPIAMGAWRNNATTTVQLYLATGTAAATVATLGLVSGSNVFINGSYEGS